MSDPNPSEPSRSNLHEQLPSLAEDDVIHILMEQHERIKALFAQLFSADGRDERHRTFLELRALLVVHETVEQIVLRPVSEPLTPPGLTERRTLEEKEATILLAELEDTDVGCELFDELLADLESVMLGHARAEEIEEFSPVVEHCSPAERAEMGRRVRAAERLAPTRPHPTLAGSPDRLRSVGPLASLIDRVRDAVA